MTPSIPSALVACAFAALLSTAGAAISVHDLSSLPQFSDSNSSSTGINVSPAGSLDGNINGGNFQFFEGGEFFIGVGPTVPVGTVLTGPLFSPGSVALFSNSSPSGQYYLPFSQESLDGDYTESVGYITFNYDNPTHTITFVSSTVQDTDNGAVTVVATVPEPSGMALLGLGALTLLRRRRN